MKAVSKKKIVTAGILIVLIAGGFWFFTREDAPVSYICLLYTSPSPRDRQKSRMPSSA